MRKQRQYKKGFEYSVGDEIEYGIILGIWKHPRRNAVLIFFVENNGRYKGTYTFYTIDEKHITGPTLNRFIPGVIVQQAYSLISGEQLPTVVSEQGYSESEDFPVPHEMKPEPTKKNYVAKIPDVEVAPRPQITETKETESKPPPIRKKRKIPPIGGLRVKRKAKDG
jgi:hypothetical protein